MTPIRLLLTLVALTISTATVAANTPCSGRKGGVSHCDNGRFICNDGTVSQSKRLCVAVDSQRHLEKKR